MPANLLCLPACLPASIIALLPACLIPLAVFVTGCGWAYYDDGNDRPDFNPVDMYTGRGEGSPSWGGGAFLLILCWQQKFNTCQLRQQPNQKPEAESKEKHGVWDPMPELTITSPYVDSRVDTNTFTMGNPMPESTLTLCRSRLYSPVRDFGFGLCSQSFAKQYIVSDCLRLLLTYAMLLQNA